MHASKAARRATYDRLKREQARRRARLIRALQEKIKAEPDQAYAREVWGTMLEEIRTHPR